MEKNAESSFFRSKQEALLAAAEIRKQHIGEQTIVRVEPSAYGGFLVRVIPFDFLVDGLGLQLFSSHGMKNYDIGS